MSDIDPPRSVHQVARDLRSVVSATRDQALALADGGTRPDDLRRAVEEIQRETSRLDHLIDQLDQCPPTPRASDSTPAPPPRALPRVLVADDDPDFLELLADLFEERYELWMAHDGSAAVEVARTEDLDLAILDLDLQGSNGFDIAQQITAAAPRRPQLMFVSGAGGTDVKVRGLSLGAADFVTKPVDGDELLARVARIIANGEHERSLLVEALTDPLTGLGNYRSLVRNLEVELERARRHDLPLSLLTVDLDGLKRINDDFGHGAGNDAICVVAEVLTAGVRLGETVARQGGDELSVLLPNTTGAAALILGERLRAAVASRSIRERPISVSVGVGSRERGDTTLDARGLVEASDVALYRSKRAGRNRTSWVQT